jgi:hypothetical protein
LGAQGPSAIFMSLYFNCKSARCSLVFYVWLSMTHSLLLRFFSVFLRPFGSSRNSSTHSMHVRPGFSDLKGAPGCCMRIIVPILRLDRFRFRRCHFFFLPTGGALVARHVTRLVRMRVAVALIKDGDPSAPSAIHPFSRRLPSSSPSEQYHRVICTLHSG